MKRLLTMLLFTVLWTATAWAASNIITTHGTDCSVATNCLVVNLPQDKGGATLTITGTWTGTIQFEAQGDGNTWTAVNVIPLASTTPATSTSANGTWQVNTAGFTGLRMRSSASMTGAATATITTSAASARNGSGGSGGGIVSINGDTSSAQTIAGTAPITVHTAAGITTIAATQTGNAASKLVSSAGLAGAAGTATCDDGSGNLTESGCSSGGSTQTALSGTAYTVATLPAGQPAGTLAKVSDGQAAGDACAAGLGTRKVTCEYTGSAWQYNPWVSMLASASIDANNFSQTVHLGCGSGAGPTCLGLTFNETTATTGLGTSGFIIRLQTADGSQLWPIEIDGGQKTGTIAIPTLKISDKWYTSGVVPGTIEMLITETASGAGSSYFNIYGGASANTLEFQVLSGGNVQANSYTATGMTPGAISVSAGSGSIPALTTNSAGFAAPVTGGTAYLAKLPAT